VVRNILENAVRFVGKKDAVSITVKGSTEFVQVAIADTGPGIRLEEQGKIFERFYRIRNEINPSRGSGLGLPIAGEIVKAHGGRIWVESEFGKGSTFFIELPKQQQEH
jgi:signal transduction histidine kinase